MTNFISAIWAYVQRIAQHPRTMEFARDLVTYLIQKTITLLEAIRADRQTANMKGAPAAP